MQHIEELKGMQLGLIPVCMWERGVCGGAQALSEMTEVMLATMVSQSVQLMCPVTLRCPSFITCDIKIITLCIPYKTFPCLIDFCPQRSSQCCYDFHLVLTHSYWFVKQSILFVQRAEPSLLLLSLFLESMRLPFSFGNQANCCGSISNKSMFLWYTLHCLF